jgi:hypothetical protein
VFISFVVHRISSYVQSRLAVTKKKCSLRMWNLKILEKMK